MATRQPNWEFIANLGDRNPLDYDGYFIYRDTTGVYTEEAEYVSVDQDSSRDPESWTVYRFSIDRLELILTQSGYVLVDAELVERHRTTGDPLRYPIERYDEWFHKDLAGVADCVGITLEQLRQDFTSDDPRIRASAYRAIGEYYGWENLDSYPLHFKVREELEERYTSGELNG